MYWKKLSIYPAAMLAVVALSMVGQSCWAQSLTRIKFTDDDKLMSVQEGTSQNEQTESQAHSQIQGGLGCDGQAAGCSSQACDSGCGGCDSMAGGRSSSVKGCGCGQRTTLRSRFGLDNPIPAGPATNLRLRSRGAYCDGECQSGCDSCQGGLLSRLSREQGQGLLSRNMGCNDGSCGTGTGSGFLASRNFGGRLGSGMINGCPDGNCGVGNGLLGRSGAGGRFSGGWGNGCPDGSSGVGTGLLGRSGAGGRLAGGWGNGCPDGSSGGTGILSGLRSRFAGLGCYDPTGERSRIGGLLADGGMGRRGIGAGDGLGALRNGCLDGRCGLAGCGLCKGGLLGPRRGEFPHTTQPNFGGDGMGGSGQAATFAYPYYTVRAPRDFLQDNPPTIGW